MQLYMERKNDNRLSSNEFQIIISFFFTEQKQRNFCLVPLIDSLESVQIASLFEKPVKPFPLERIIYQFQSGFYGYKRLAANERCILQHFLEPKSLIPIGITQMNKIRKIEKNYAADASNYGIESVTNQIQLSHYIWKRKSPRQFL